MTRSTQWLYGWLLLLPPRRCSRCSRTTRRVATLWHSF